MPPLPPNVYGNGCLLNNTKPTHLKGGNELRLQPIYFLLPSSTKFCHLINGGDQSIIDGTTEIQSESF
jgi:hypothetical protein